MINTINNIVSDFYSNWYSATLIEYYMYLSVFLDQTWSC